MDLDCYTKFLVRNCREAADGVAVLEKDYGIWNKYTWKQCYETVKTYSLGFVGLGLMPGYKVLIISGERPEALWTLAAIQAAGGIPVPVWPDSSADEIAFYANHSESTFVVCEDQEQVDKILEIEERIPMVKNVLYWDPKGMRAYDDRLLMSYEELLELGRRYETEHSDSFEQMLSRVNGDSIAIMTYTSGTTGEPKGCMCSHRDLLSTSRGWWARIPVRQGDRIVSLIPPAHVFEQWTAGAHYLEKVTMCFCEEPETVVADLRDTAPTVLVMSPGMWISLWSDAQVRIGDAAWINRLIYRLFLPVGYVVAGKRLKKERVNLFWRTLYLLGTWLVFRPLKDKLGLSKMAYPHSGSALIDPDALRFYHAIGVKLEQFYSLTEAGVCNVPDPDDVNPETNGPPCPGRSVRISEHGEILVNRAGGFVEYHKDPQRTAERFEGDWVRTGDAGTITTEGHLVFMDRLENLSQLRGGTKYAPAFIEAKLKFSPYIEEAVIIGSESTDYISAMMVMNLPSVSNWAERNHIAFTTFVDLSQKEEVSELVRKEVERVNKVLPAASRIKKYVLLHKEFDPDDAELTRSRKTRPAIIRQRYADIIEAMYADKDEVPVVASVTYRDGRTGTVRASLRIRTA